MPGVAANATTDRPRVTAALFAVLALSAALACAIVTANEPVLLLQALLVAPLQPLLVPSVTHDGHAVVKVPRSVRRSLESALERSSKLRSFGGPGEAIESPIVRGRTLRIALTADAKRVVREGLRPLVRAYCGGCALASAAQVSAIRVYSPGASLLEHLDRPDAFLLAVTVRVAVPRRMRRARRRGLWPLTLRRAGSWGRRDAPVHHAHQLVGEAVIYEGAGMWHARPTPLGEGAEPFAVCFVGFAPLDLPRRPLLGRAMEALARVMHGRTHRYNE